MAYCVNESCGQSTHGGQWVLVRWLVVLVVGGLGDVKDQQKIASMNQWTNKSDIKEITEFLKLSSSP